jgi:hypothetical protein
MGKSRKSRQAKMTNSDRRAAFFHVIDPHRWLAASGCSWNLVGPNATNDTKKTLDELVPNIIVMIRDCALVHARSLIDFYSKTDSDCTDILLSDFSISLAQEHREKLAAYKKPIEVHLLHLTDWRTPEFRSRHATGKDANKVRPDWNRDISLVTELVLDALKKVSSQPGDWQQPFEDLYKATAARYRDKSSVWPANLCEKDGVERYLLSLGR